MRLDDFSDSVPSKKVVRQAELFQIRQQWIELCERIIVNVGITEIQAPDLEALIAPQVLGDIIDALHGEVVAGDLDPLDVPDVPADGPQAIVVHVGLLHHQSFDLNAIHVDVIEIISQWKNVMHIKRMKRQNNLLVPGRRINENILHSGFENAVQKRLLRLQPKILKESEIKLLKNRKKMLNLFVIVLDVVIRFS